MMNVQLIGRYKCDHNQAAHTKKSNLSQLNEQLKSQKRKSKPLRTSWVLFVCAYYFGALFFNAKVFGIDFGAYEPSVILTPDEWKHYFFNASLVALSCLAFIALIPGKASFTEKVLSVTFFISLVFSALLYDDQNGWWLLNELDIVLQYGITAVISMTGLFLVCQLFRYYLLCLVLYLYR